MQYSIRPVVEADLEAIYLLLNREVELFTNNFDWTPSALEAVKAKWTHGSKRYPWLVIEVEKEGLFQFAGVAYASPFRMKDAYYWTAESTIYLHQDYQALKLGQPLYKALLDRLKACEIVTVVACITMGNLGSIRFHEKLGFVKNGEVKRAGYKLGQWLDIGFWTLELQPEGYQPEGLPGGF